MDVLSDAVLTTCWRPHSNRNLLRAPWGVRFPATDGAASTSCSAAPAGCSRRGRAVRLAAGDIVLLPREPGHALADEPGSPLVPFQPGRRDRHDEPGAGAATELLCAYYMFDLSRPHPLLADLPTIVHLPARVGQHPSLRSAVDLLGDELRDPRSGTEAALPALIDMLLLYVLRAGSTSSPGDAVGWARALRDPAVTTALRQIHRHPDQAVDGGRPGGPGRAVPGGLRQALHRDRRAYLRSPT